MKREELINNIKKVESKSTYDAKENIARSAFRIKFDLILFRAIEVKEDLLENRRKYKNNEISLLEFINICGSCKKILSNLQKELNKGQKNLRIKFKYS
jgi:hypothetical protein